MKVSTEFIKNAYDKIADLYLQQRNRYRNKETLEYFNSLLVSQRNILDIGCGTGIPIDTFFVKKGHSVIGIDISEKMLEIAKKSIPEATLVRKDILSLKKGEYSVDAVISFYTIFNIPKEEHQRIFNIINSFLPMHGLLLVTMGTEERELTEEFLGATMHWSNFDVKKNRAIITRAGFKILKEEIEKGGGVKGGKHQIIIAQKTKEV